MEPTTDLHPDLHPRRTALPGRLLVLARVAGLAVVDFEVADSPRHGNSVALLLVLAVLANLGGLVWLLGRIRSEVVELGALMLLSTAGGLLAALQHGSPALAMPAVAVAQVAANASVLGAVATGSLAVLALEAGVVIESRGAGDALGYPGIIIGAALLGVTRRQYVMQARATSALLDQRRQTEAESRRAAALDERTRIAREIHDVLAHALGGLSVQLESAELLLAERGDVAGALERIASARRTAREGLEEARRARWLPCAVICPRYLTAWPA